MTGLGYVVDCSITPKINWSERKDKLSDTRGPDFRGCSVRPFRFPGGLLEVPMTILYAGIFRDENGWIAKRFTFMPDGFVKKVLQKLFFRRKWLRIFPQKREADWKAVYKSAVKNKLPILEFMIHSSELMAGGSPSAKDQQTVDFVFRQLEEMLKIFQKKQIGRNRLSRNLPKIIFYDFRQ